MRVTYDASADAAYFYLSDRPQSIETRQIDDDINIDFNEHDQMVGIEVLAASERLRLSDFGHAIENLDTNWATLTEALKGKKTHNIPVVSSGMVEKVWVKDIDYSYIVVKSESGELRKVNAYQLLGSHSKDPLIRTLRKMGNYANRKNKVILQ